MIVLPIVMGVMALLSADSTPQDQYRMYFHGVFARTGQCEKPDQLWTFEARRMSKGRLTCAINNITATRNGAIRLQTKACTTQGTPVSAITFTLDLVSDEVIEVVDGTGTYMLRRCRAY
ncbi:hypothetical protein [Parvularcula sp. LCG005]|uniref:hypothetical protein n=1 Tax=Parvularcula sp. LCG005 TaxID=3078805 RepID=UPI0029424D72|nr:hypothetical protein [Parvularcula sp. LCG005]WOI52072.1 hypothetical protein RUI03_07865 [Parvularcula sp. LCG005]